MPQVNAATLLQPPAAPGHPCPPSGSYWGWFSFHTSAFAPHRLRFLELMTVQPHLEAAIESAAAQLRRVDGCPELRQVWGIHMRCGEGFTPLSMGDDVQSSGVDAAPAPAHWQPAPRTGLDASSGTTGLWRDTGVFWTPPDAWLTDWLSKTLANAPTAAPAPLVLLFSDDPSAAVRVLGPLGARTVADVLGEAVWAGLAAAFGGGQDGEALADFFLMTRCEQLAVSNSTFSFAAAMVATAADANRCACFRPDPGVGALVPFDPWDAQPTLKLESREYG